MGITVEAKRFPRFQIPNGFNEFVIRPVSFLGNSLQHKFVTRARWYIFAARFFVAVGNRGEATLLFTLKVATIFTTVVVVSNKIGDRVLNICFLWF